MTIQAKAKRGFLGNDGRVRRNQPLTLDQGEFDRLKALGLVEKATTKGKGTAPQPVDDLDEKSVADLRELAAAETVDLGEATKKADVITAIRAARAVAA